MIRGLICDCQSKELPHISICASGNISHCYDVQLMLLCDVGITNPLPLSTLAYHCRTELYGVDKFIIRISIRLCTG